MIRINSILAGSLALGIAAFAATAGYADTTIGAPGIPNNGNTYPFGGGVVKWQEIFDASNFSGTQDITGITYFNKNYLPGSVHPADYAIDLSTTSQTVAGLSGNFNSNLGADNTEFFAGSLGGTIDPVSHEFTITGQHDFVYDPSQGNLLVTVTLDNAGNGGDVYLDAVEGNGANFARVYSWTDPSNGNVDGEGLVTRFDTGNAVVTPEPASFAAFGFGAFGIAGMALRARKSRKQSS